MADFLSGVENSLEGVEIPGFPNHRRNGWLSALLNVGPGDDQPWSERLPSSPERQPRLLQAMNQGNTGQPYDPGMSAPESTYSANGKTRTVDNVQNNRIEDDRSRHPGERPSLLGPGEQPEYQPAGQETGPAGASPRLIDQMNQTPSRVAAAEARLVDAMKPQGIEALHATARNPFVRGLEKFGIGALKGLDVAGTAFSPGIMSAIPGTRLNERVKQGRAQSGLSAAIQDWLKESQAEDYQSQAASRAQPTQPEVHDTDEGPIQYNRRTGQWEPITIGGQRVGPKGAKPDLETTAAGRRQLADQYGLQGDDKIRYILTGQFPVDKPDKPDTATQLDQQYDAIRAKEMSGQPLTPQEKAFKASYRERKTMGPSAGATIRVEGAVKNERTKQSDTEYNLAQDADERLSRMEAAYQKGLKGDQQAMLSMLTDHIGMTLGLQKGARITKDILNEAQQSQPWLAKIAAKFDDRGYLSGVALGPDQMRQMLDLGYEARNRKWDRAFQTSQMYDTPEPAGARKIYSKRDPNKRIYDQQQGGGSGGQVQVTDPRGVTHTFPDQKSADAFKKAAGIQ